MKRKDLIREMTRENATRRRIFPRWIQIGKINREVAERRLQCTELIEAVLDAMTDDEFTKLVGRLEIKADHEQGSLF